MAARKAAMTLNTVGMSKEHLLAAIVDSAIDFTIISMDREGVVVTWNEALALSSVGARKR